MYGEICSHCQNKHPLGFGVGAFTNYCRVSGGGGVEWKGMGGGARLRVEEKGERKGGGSPETPN